MWIRLAHRLYSDFQYFFYQTCGGVAVGAGLPHFQSAAKAPQAFGANVIHGRREGETHVEEE